MNSDICFWKHNYHRPSGNHGLSEFIYPTMLKTRLVCCVHALVHIVTCSLSTMYHACTLLLMLHISSLAHHSFSRRVNGVFLDLE